MRLHLTDVEVDGCPAEVVVEGCEAVLLDGERVMEDLHVPAAGGALLPGLHDHHVHLLAMAAPSVDVSGARSAEELGRLLRDMPGAWVRARGYHESIAGTLDRAALDRLAPDRPARVQHRSGALWMLNSRALREVAHVLDGSADVERDAGGEPTGRLWRYDARLRPALPQQEPDLGGVGEELLRWGITGVTDATPDLEPEAIGLIAQARATGRLPQQVTLLGVPDAWPGEPGLSAGPAKLLLPDHDLPGMDEIAEWVAARHEQRRPVAIHCVTSDALALVVGALDAVGSLGGDRIEHASVVPPGLRPDLVRLGVRVVTQPDFLRTRGEDYLRDVDPGEQPFLYPYGSLVDAGVAVAPSSDAPYGEADPWQVIRSATSRTSRTAKVLGADEAVGALTALNGYLSGPADPGAEFWTTQMLSISDTVRQHHQGKTLVEVTDDY